MKYSKVQIYAHWLTAVLVVVMAATGLAFSYELGDKAVLRAHQIAGQLLVLVVVIRIVSRLASPPKTFESTDPAWQQWAAWFVHLALYMALVGYITTGYVSASALGDNALIWPVNIGFARSDLGEEILYWHYRLKWVLLALLAVHIAAALKHALWDRDDTFARMTFPSSKE